MKSVLVKNGRLMVDTKNDHILDGDILIRNGKCPNGLELNIMTETSSRKFPSR